MLSHEDYYNMKYILKDKKILLNIYQVHEFIDSLPSMNIEKILKKRLESTWRISGEHREKRLKKRLKSLPGEDIIDIPRRMRYNCNR